ncbi:hypothetical protein ACHQM5_018646 [Ranunculus cassubicifolius]
MDDTRWKTQFQADSRQRIVSEIMDTLKRHIPFSCPAGLLELTKIAVRYEEKIYTSGVTQWDYLRKISLTMRAMETRTQNNNNPMPNPLPLHPPNPVSISVTCIKHVVTNTLLNSLLGLVGIVSSLVSFLHLITISL